MIKSVKITNFESYTREKFKLHPGVNVFTGGSDEGKSGIIRAITWNAENRPLGDGFRSDLLDPKKDKKVPVQVSIDYETTGLVTRSKDATGKNYYYVEGQKEPLRALRTDVPDEIQDMSLMEKVNIQGQHPSEQYFLLTDKPGHVAKKFNKVAGLVIMDKAITEVNSQVRDCNAEIKVAKAEIETRTDELKETEWVIRAEKLAKKLKAFKIKLDKKDAKWKALKNIIIQIQEVERELKEYDGIKAAKIALNSLIKKSNEIESKKKEQFKQQAIVFDLSDVDSRLKQYNDIDKALKALKTLKKEQEEYKVKWATNGALKTLLKEIQCNKEFITTAEEEYKKAKITYDDIFENKACPTCGRKGK